MKVRTQQLNPVIGDIRSNTAVILDAIHQAQHERIDLLMFPELAVCGYPPMDLLERKVFREVIYASNQEIIKATGETGVIFGTITANPSAFGRKCFNTAVMAFGGKVAGRAHKTLLPTYDVFDDLRYFEPNSEFDYVEFKGARLGITICEDIWYNENDIQYHTYKINPARELVERGADAIINISASPFTKTKPSSRQQMLQNHAKSVGVPVFYCNQVGANTELIFDGDSMVISSDARVIARSPLFKEDYLDVEWNPATKDVNNIGHPPAQIPPFPECIFNGLVLGLSDYLVKSTITDKIILGLSGGIDSTLVACVAAEALGAEKVVGVTMPSEFSSEGSIADSEELANNLGIKLYQLPVKALYEEYQSTLEPLFQNTEFDVTEENIQSRIRGTLLMAISNKFGYMLLNTGNKSELATGYCTLYGDMAGGLGIISDIYKTEVYQVARWLNESYYQHEIIPENILIKPPSAELRPGQKDTDTLPEYEIMDGILKLYIEQQQSVSEIVQKGYPKKTAEKITELVNYTEYKRFQAVPGLKVSTKAFGTGRRWPIVHQWTKNQFL